MIHRLPRLVRRYRRDLPFQGRLSLLGSTVFNACYALFKLGFGIYYRSFWFGAVAVYYLLLAAIRAFLFFAGARVMGDPAREYRVARACGGLLLILNAALTAVTIQMVRDGRGYYYPGYLIFVAALYAFYAMTMAIVNLVRFRKLKSPVLSAAKALNLAVALVSMLSLQTAMFASFGGELRDQWLMNALTGAGVCLSLFLMAVLMIARAGRNIKQGELCHDTGK